MHLHCILVLNHKPILHYRWIKNEYNNPTVIITENGWSDRGGLEDDGRIAYFRDHLEQVLNAVLNENCDVKGYSG